MSKVGEKASFIDISDYARPLANKIVLLLLPTNVTPNMVTLSYFILSIIAAYFIYIRWYIFAAILILLKGLLDAVDGSLARRRNKPSRVGRFLDAILDFFVNGIILLAINPYNFILPWFFITLQVSMYNYFSVSYRHYYQGDTTSKIIEDNEIYPWDNPTVVKILYSLYIIIYKWQDMIFYYIDKYIIQDKKIKYNKIFMTMVSILGLGTYLLILSLLLILNVPGAFIRYIYFMNIYSVILIVFAAVASNNN